MTVSSQTWYSPADLVVGTVSRVAPFGVFVACPGGWEGLLLVPDCRLPHGQTPDKNFPIEQELQVQVVRVADPENKMLRVVLPGDAPHEERRGIDYQE